MDSTQGMFRPGPISVVQYDETEVENDDEIIGRCYCRYSGTYAVDPRCVKVGKLIGYRSLLLAGAEIKMLPTLVYLFFRRRNEAYSVTFENGAVN